MSGANSIFVGDKLLTTKNNAVDADTEMFQLLGLKGKEPTHDDTIRQPEAKSEALRSLPQAPDQSTSTSTSPSHP